MRTVKTLIRLGGCTLILLVLSCRGSFVPLFLHLSFQFSNIKNFRHTFLRNGEAYKVETWYAHGHWVDVSSIPQSGCCLFFRLFLLLFLSNFQTINFFCCTFLRNCEAYKVETWYMWTMNGCIVYTAIMLLLLLLPFILFSFSPILNH